MDFVIGIAIALLFLAIGITWIGFNVLVEVIGKLERRMESVELMLHEMRERQ